MTRVELRTTAMAVGGEAIAREASGRVVFVAGALPDETVLVDLADERKSFARGLAVEVLDPSPDRVQPPCPHVAEGCGGCDWQHASEPAQHRIRRDLVTEVLTRTGGVVDPQVVAGPPLASTGLRTTVRGVADDSGRFGFRRRRSHDVIAVDACLIAHPMVVDIIESSSFAPGASVMIRVGARTGEAMVVVGPHKQGARVPDGVILVGENELESGRRVWLHEEVAGRTWRVSARSFFQASPEGAEALVTAVRAGIDAHAPDATRLVDLCSGVGLFGGTLGEGRSVVGVERSAAAVADARHNLADRDVRLIKVALAKWRPSPADVVVADPARRGLAPEGVAAVAGTNAPLCMLVSCDPAALGRDAKLLAEHGYRHGGSAVIDLFGHSSHIEVVSAFVRGDRADSAPMSSNSAVGAEHLADER